MSEPSEMEEPKEEREPWSIPLSSKLAVPKAVWVPSSILCLCAIAQVINDNTTMHPYFRIPFISAQFVVWVLWGTLRKQPIVKRLSIATFSMMLLVACIDPDSLTFFDLIDTIRPIWVFGVITLLLRYRCGWLLIIEGEIEIYQSDKFRFSTKQLLICTTLLAFLMMLLHRINGSLDVPESIFPRQNSFVIGVLMFFANELLFALLLNSTDFLFTIIPLMERDKIVKRLMVMIAVAAFLGFLVSQFGIFAWTFFAYKAAGPIFFGLALRWAGYRIVRQTDTVSKADSTQPPDPILAT